MWNRVRTKKKSFNITTGDTSNTQVNGNPGKTIASSSCDVTGYLETVWEFWYPSRIGQPHSAKEFLILFVDVCVCMCFEGQRLCSAKGTDAAAGGQVYILLWVGMSQVRVMLT